MTQETEPGRARLNASVPAGTTWASIADVFGVTQVTVQQAHVDAAQSIVELLTGRLFDDSASIRSRDLVWLKRAVSYQAAWIFNTPDVFSRNAFSSLTQDGLIMALSEKSSVYLAPLARRAIKSCSWMRSRSLRLRTPFLDPGSFTGNELIDDSRDTWERM